MKTTIKTIILAAASLFAAMSCQKETAGTQDLVEGGETIRVSINAGLGDFVAADATKATAESVIRLKWTSSDVVQAYCGTDKISTGDGLTVTPSENGLFAKLTGEITTTSLTSGTSVITFVYSNVNNTASTGEAPTFDFSSQDGTIPFVAYATLVYDGATTLTDKMVEFKFATSVMKIAATNLGGGDITKATIDGINTEVKLSPSTSDAAANIVSGDVKGTITKTAGIAASTDKTRAIFTVGLVPDKNTSRKLTINGKEAALTSSEIECSKSYTTPCAFASGSSDEDEYVVMKMKPASGPEYTRKWAKKNLGAVDINGYGELYSWGEVATKFNYSEAKYVASGISKDLNKADGNDVANALKGGKWRMPTRDEFMDLDRACGGTGENDQLTKAIEITDIDDNGKVKVGRYWLAAKQTTLKDIDELKDINVAGLLYSDGEHYLFFLSAGNSDNNSRVGGGNNGNYWSSTWDGKNNAYNLYFNSVIINPQDSDRRYWGRSVRPVSD